MSTEMLRSPGHFEGLLRPASTHLAAAWILNRRQALALANPSPECDSLVEALALLVPRSPEEELAHYKSRRYAEVLNRLNAWERIREEEAQQHVDDAASGLHSLRLGPPADRLTARSLARALRGPLSVLAEPSPARPGQGASAVLDAVRALCRVIGAAPRSQLLSPAVAHELAPRKAALLRYLLQDEGERHGGAGRSPDPSSGSDHGAA